MKLAGKAAIVTGAGRNIGEEIAVLFAQEGAKVAVVGPTGKVGRLAVKRLVEQGYTPRILLRHKPAAAAAPSLAKDADKDSVAAYLCGLEGVEAVAGDINDRASLDELLQGCSAKLNLTPC